MRYVISGQPVSLALFVQYARGKMKNYNIKDLAGIGAVAVLLNAVGLALMIWSGFWVGLFGLALQGVYWAMLGIVIVALTTKKEHAL